MKLGALPIICVLAGALLLLENYGYIPEVHRFWPLLILIVGTGFIFLFWERGRQDPALLGTGVYLVLFSIYAQINNFISWKTVATTWPLFIAFLGISFISIPVVSGRNRPALGIGVGLILLSLVFLIVFSVDYRLWPVSLIAFGFCIWLVRRIK